MTWVEVLCEGVKSGLMKVETTRDFSVCKGYNIAKCTYEICIKKEKLF